MLILAFETSCDDTSIALFEDTTLLAMRTRSQIREHNETQWVVPEVAARLHANVIFDVLTDILTETGKTLEEIDLIACTESPGLMPSLLVGMTVAKTIARLLDIEYMAIDHIQAHMFANYLERGADAIAFPAVCLTVSGGHNEIYLWRSMFEREKLGETLDDSAGEAFDKVAKMMGLGYPGGPIIGQLSAAYTGAFRGIFPEVLLDRQGYDFSFSGLKSAVKREVDKRINSPLPLGEGLGVRASDKGSEVRWELSESDIHEIAFEFEQTVVNILTYKLFLAAEKHGMWSVVLAGGVSANDRLCDTIQKEAEKRGFSCTIPAKKIYSQDNAAMVGILAYYRSQQKT